MDTTAAVKRNAQAGDIWAVKKKERDMQKNFLVGKGAVVLRAKRTPEDPEKLITPGLIYVQKEYKGFLGIIIAIGWWDFSVSISYARRKKAK